MSLGRIEDTKISFQINWPLGYGLENKKKYRKNYLSFFLMEIGYPLNARKSQKHTNLFSYSQKNKQIFAWFLGRAESGKYFAHFLEAIRKRYFLFFLFFEIFWPLNFVIDFSAIYTADAFNSAHRNGRNISSFLSAVHGGSWGCRKANINDDEDTTKVKNFLRLSHL